MKNKGLTIMELLGVIVILGTLTIITVPIIANSINKSRLSALEESANGLLESAKLYYANNDNTKTIRFDKNIEGQEDNLEKLHYKGKVEKGTVVINKWGKVTLCINSKGNSVYKNYNEAKPTVVSKQTCSIPESTYVVYLDNEATIEELDNLQLTEIVSELTERLEEVEKNKVSIDDVYPVGSVYITTTENTVAKVQAKFGGTWVAFGKGKTLVGLDSEDTSFDTVEETGGEKTHTLTVAEMPLHTHTFTGTTNQLTGNNNQDHTHSGNTGWQSHDHSHTRGSMNITGGITLGVDNNNASTDAAWNGTGAFVGSNVIGAGSAVASTTWNVGAGFSFDASRSWTGSTSGTSSNHYHAFTTGGQSGAHNHYFTATGTNSNTGGGNAHNNLQPYITVYMYKRTS